LPAQVPFLTQQLGIDGERNLPIGSFFEIFNPTAFVFSSKDYISRLGLLDRNILVIFFRKLSILGILGARFCGSPLWVYLANCYPATYYAGQHMKG
jgi:hypothetical protein